MHKKRHVQKMIVELHSSAVNRDNNENAWQTRCCMMRWRHWLVRLQTLQLDVMRHSDVSRRQPAALRCLPGAVGVSEPWRSTAGRRSRPSAGVRHSDDGRCSRTTPTALRLRRRLPSTARPARLPRLHAHSSQRHRLVALGLLVGCAIQISVPQLVIVTVIVTDCTTGAIIRDTTVFHRDTGVAVMALGVSTKLLYSESS